MRRLIYLLAGLAATSLAHAQLTGPLTTSDGAMVVKSDGSPLYLKNNPEANNVTLAELMDFIKADTVDRIAYRDNYFDCTEFAQRLHDNAEQRGIRAGVVLIELEEGEGHAANVFQTVDRGLVVVDCTGGSGKPAWGGYDTYDTFGYIRKGKPYGRVQVEIAKDRPADYKFYEEVEAIRAGLHVTQENIALERDAILQARERMRQAAAGLKTPEEAEAHNRAVAKFNAVNDEFNRKVVIFNARLGSVGPRYDTSKSPVKRVESFW